MRLLAEHIMSRNLLKINFQEKILVAHDMMKKNGVRHLPVTDQEGQVVGIISDRDVQRAMKPFAYFEETHPMRADDHFPDDDFPDDIRVRHYMSWPLKTVHLRADLRLVVGQMIMDKISALLVTEETRPVGIITSEDLLKLLLGLMEHSASFSEQGLRAVNQAI